MEEKGQKQRQRKKKNGKSKGKREKWVQNTTKKRHSMKKPINDS